MDNKIAFAGLAQNDEAAAMRDREGKFAMLRASIATYEGTRKSKMELLALNPGLELKLKLMTDVDNINDEILKCNSALQKLGAVERAPNRIFAAVMKDSANVEASSDEDDNE
jgi:hypothetical protein